MPVQSDAQLGEPEMQCLPAVDFITVVTHHVKYLKNQFGKNVHRIKKKKGMLYCLEVIDGMAELLDDKDAIKGQVFLMKNPTPCTRVVIFWTKHLVSSHVVPVEYKNLL